MIRKKFHIDLNIGETPNGEHFHSVLCSSAYKVYCRVGPSFVGALTLLFELLAKVVAAYESVVRDYYGPGRMLFIARYLQSEADFHAIKVLDAFSEKRALSRRVLVMKECFY